MQFRQTLLLMVTTMSIASLGVAGCTPQTQTNAQSTQACTFCSDTAT
jgi:hypothetical protein